MVSFMGLIPMNSSHGSDSHVLILVFSVHVSDSRGLIHHFECFLMGSDSHGLIMFPYGV